VHDVDCSRKIYRQETIKKEVLIMVIEVRKMTLQDISQVQQVAKISWHHTYEGIIPRHIQDNFLATAYSDENMVRRVERSYAFVALLDEQVVGFANFSYVKDDGTSELAAIYLLPESQGKGLGTKLLEQGLTLPNVRAIELNVKKDNASGMNFYLSKGFKQIDSFKEDYEGDERETVRMRLDINK